jgi:curved DNA-binding protein
MNRPQALLALGLTKAISSDDIQYAFRKCAKSAHTNLLLDNDNHLRRLIEARDFLMHALISNEDLSDASSSKANDQTQRLDISLHQAINGGIIQTSVPIALAEVNKDLSGSIPLMKTLNITLPKGLRTGDRLRLKASDKGAVGPLFDIEITSENGVYSVGNDIWMTAEIESRLFFSGGETEIDTPHGPHAIYVTRGLKEGACLCLKGLGLIATEKHKQGHLYIRLTTMAQEVRPAEVMLSEFQARWGKA